MNVFRHISDLSTLIVLLLLTACSQQEEVLDPDPTPVPGEKSSAVTFSTTLSETEEVQTRGYEALAKDFQVWGFKKLSNAMEQVVFNNYTVRYVPNSAYTSEDNTNDYTYLADAGQEMKYWDHSSGDYHFWGYTSSPTSGATYDAAEKLLTIPWSLHVGDPLHADYIYFSKLHERNPVHNDVVRLEFMRPFAKVRIQFYTSVELFKDDYINLSDILFAPLAGEVGKVDKIYNQGKVYVKYPAVEHCLGGAKENIYIDKADLSDPQDDLPFMDVQLSGTEQLGVSSNTAVTAPIDDDSEDFTFDLGNMPGGGSLRASTRAGEKPGRKYYYYPLPMSPYNPAFRLSVCVDGNDEPVTADVPAQYMQWQANHSYTYIFKILEGGVLFVDAKVEEWQSGGATSDKWTNW